MTLVRSPVAVWIDDDGKPSRLVWEGQRYRVSDEPTALADFLDERITHLPVVPPVGWRFQGTDDSGRSRVFDVRFDPARSQWLLVGTYV